MKPKKRARPGREPKPKLSVSLSPEILTRIDRMARAWGASCSGTVERMIREWWERYAESELTKRAGVDAWEPAFTPPHGPDLEDEEST